MNAHPKGRKTLPFFKGCLVSLQPVTIRHFTLPHGMSTEGVSILSEVQEDVLGKHRMVNTMSPEEGISQLIAADKPRARICLRVDDLPIHPTANIGQWCQPVKPAYTKMLSSDLIQSTTVLQVFSLQECTTP